MGRPLGPRLMPIVVRRHLRMLGPRRRPLTTAKPAHTLPKRAPAPSGGRQRDRPRHGSVGGRSGSSDRSRSLARGRRRPGDGGRSRDLRGTDHGREDRHRDEAEARSNGRHRGNSATTASASGARASQQAEKLAKKRYAWMDSDDENSAEGSESEASGEGGRSGKTHHEKIRLEMGVATAKASATRAGSSRSKSQPVRSRARQDASDDRALPMKVAEVRAFADMVRLAPDIQRRAARMAPKELAAVVSAASRVKFYDADAFQAGLLPAAKRHLHRSTSSFTADEAVDFIAGLAELNVYDKAIFSKVVEMFAGTRRGELEDHVRRGRLLAAFKAVGHSGDEDFVEYLTRRNKLERYDNLLRESQGSSGPQIYYGGLRK